MPEYRRWRVPGGTYFFTINLLERRSDLLVRHVDALRDAVRRTRRERPFHIDAWVVLPGHMHCTVTLPEGDDDFSSRIKGIKVRFVRAIPEAERRSRTRIGEGPTQRRGQQVDTGGRTARAQSRPSWHGGTVDAPPCRSERWDWQGRRILRRPCPRVAA